MILDTCVTSRNVEMNPSVPQDNPPFSMYFHTKLRLCLRKQLDLKN